MIEENLSMVENPETNSRNPMIARAFTSNPWRPWVAALFGSIVFGEGNKAVERRKIILNFRLIKLCDG